MNSHADGLAVNLCWGFKVDMLENSSPSISTCPYVMVSLHITRFANASPLRTSASSVAVPISTSTPDLNVEIGARIPLKNHVHT